MTDRTVAGEQRNDRVAEVTGRSRPLAVLGLVWPARPVPRTGPGSASCDREEHAMSIEPPRRHGDSERGRMVAPGHRSDDGTMCTLLVVYENDGTWSFHGLGAPGVKVSGSDATALAQGILKVSK